jgi:hypothetical protein
MTKKQTNTVIIAVGNNLLLSTRTAIDGGEFLKVCYILKDPEEAS